MNFRKKIQTAFWALLSQMTYQLISTLRRNIRRSREPVHPNSDIMTIILEMWAMRCDLVIFCRQATFLRLISTESFLFWWESELGGARTNFFRLFIVDSQRAPYTNCVVTNGDNRGHHSHKVGYFGTILCFFSPLFQWSQIWTFLLETFLDFLVTFLIFSLPWLSENLSLVWLFPCSWGCLQPLFVQLCNSEKS